jgi:hypothetical protein
MTTYRILILSSAAELVIVPSRYIGILATRRESFWIAGLGFVLSAAFWAAISDVVNAIPQRRRKRKTRDLAKEGRALESS